MRPWVLALVAATSTMWLFGLPRRWPWRVATLQSVDSTSTSSPPRRRLPRLPARVRGVAGARRISSERRRRREIERDLPASIDMLHLAISAGHSLHTAIAAVGAAGQGPVSRELGRVADAFDHGGRLAAELETLPLRLGSPARALTTTLVVASASGAPLGPALQRLADAERRRLRRRTEERVRRLPVLLLAPLVGLILPAFVVLTIVPVGITTARSGLLGAPGAHDAVVSSPASSPSSSDEPPRSPP